MPKLIECPECHWKYPDNILNSMFIGGGGSSPPICGQCALDIRNKIHGIMSTKWDGIIAEHMRLLALKWRKKNKQHAPTV